VNLRSARAVLIWSALLAVVLAATAAPVAAVNELTDGIAPGVVRTHDGFGSDTVVVPTNAYVTYFVQGAPNLAGTILQIWTNSGGEWKLASTRSFDADGTSHYFARVTGRTSFQARIPGTPGGAAHGRVATTWANATDRRTRISVGCDAFEEDAGSAEGSSALIGRTAAVKSGTQLDVVLCSNVSTGFGWDAPAIDSEHLRLIGHRYVNGPNLAGAPGTEIWSFRVVGRGAGHALMAYSQPWVGGQKAAWSFVLTTLS
jgi:predicted secreted protein